MFRQTGFTLIEMLIVISLISILIAVGTVNYAHTFMTEKRMEASGALLQLALALERYFIEHETYENATLAALEFNEWCAQHHYRLSIQQTGSDHYLIAAIPQGTQERQDANCGTLLLDDLGRKTITGPGKIDACWR